VPCARGVKATVNTVANLLKYGMRSWILSRSQLTLIIHWLFVSDDVKQEFEILKQAILSISSYLFINLVSKSVSKSI
jgi:hypothetical protein